MSPSFSSAWTWAPASTFIVKNWAQTIIGCIRETILLSHLLWVWSPRRCHTLHSTTVSCVVTLLAPDWASGYSQMGLVQSRLGPRVGKKLCTGLKTAGARGWTWCQRCDQLSVLPGVPGHPCTSNSHFGFKVTWPSLVFPAQKHTLKKQLSSPWSNDILRCHVRDVSGGSALHIDETRIRLLLFCQEILKEVVSQK